MTQISILEHVVYADGSTNPVTANITREGCVVQWQESSVSLTWDQMADAEHLSNVFEDVTVRVFKCIVQMLGKVYANQAAYMMVL